MRQTSGTSLIKLLVIVLSAISFAYLNLLPLWTEASAIGTGQAYFLPDPSPRHAQAALAAFGLLAIIAMFAFIGSRLLPPNLGNRIIGAMLALSLVNPLSYNGWPLFDREWRLTLLEIWPWNLDVLVGLFCLLVLVLAGAGAFAGRKLIRPFAAAFVVVSPYALFSLIEPVRYAFHDFPTAPAFQTGNSAPGHETTGRVVWIVFDELDPDALVLKIPSELANFRKFAADASMNRTIPQAAPSTLHSIPGMLIGRAVLVARPAGADRLRLKFASPPASEDWRETDHVFRRASASGARIAVTGWYHPYCRLFDAFMRNCTYAALGGSIVAPTPGFLSHVIDGLSVVNPLFRRHKALAAIAEFRAAAREQVADPNLDLVFLHFFTPHQPTIYDASQARFTAYNFSRAGYFDNLAAADKILGELREAMENAKLWDKSSVIITADHAWRGSTRGPNKDPGNRVPLLFKPAVRTPANLVGPGHATELANFVVRLLSVNADR